MKWGRGKSGKWRRGKRGSRAASEVPAEGDSPPAAEGVAEGVSPSASGGAATAGQTVAHRWGKWGEQWKEWLRRSPVGAELLLWWDDDVRGLVGDAGFQERLVELLSRASPRDCALMGLGCTRRIDRACREPGTCSLDPVDPPEPDGVRERTGPVPGACDSFVDCWTELELRVDFTSDDRHRAVLLRDKAGSGWTGLWVDGVRVAEEVELDQSGCWLDDRFYVIEAAGPEEHPEQSLAMGHLACRITSKVIHDAERATTQVLVPDATETWTRPCLRLRGDTWRVYPDLAALEADRPDRVLPVVPQVP